MLNSSDWFQINSPSIVCDVVDEEVVFVNLENGAYYSTEKAGLAIWQHLNEGQTLETIIQSLSAQYEGTDEEFSKSVYDLAKTLLDEAIIVPGSGESSAPPHTAEQAEKEPFEGVTLQKFQDMEDLLLLDPVHEVADTGWPNKSG